MAASPYLLRSKGSTIRNAWAALVLQLGEEDARAIIENNIAVLRFSPKSKFFAATASSSGATKSSGGATAFFFEGDDNGRGRWRCERGRFTRQKQPDSLLQSEPKATA
jgi:hypothetical protein